MKTCAFWVEAEFGYNLNQVFGSLKAFHVFISKNRDGATAGEPGIITRAALTVAFTMTQSVSSILHN